MLALALALLSAPALSAPLQLTWQARLLDGVGAPIEGQRDVVVRLYDAADGVVWERTFTGVALADGFTALTLGTDTTGRTLEQALHAAAPAETLGLQVVGEAELSPRQPLLAVPRAATADGVSVGAGLSGGACVGEGRLAYDAAAARLVVCGGGTWRAAGGSCSAAEVDVSGTCVPCGTDAVMSLRPLLYWPLDEVSGNVADRAGGWTGTRAGTVSSGVDGPAWEGTGVTFAAGTANHVVRSGFPFPGAAQSVAMWVRGGGTDDGLISYATATSDNAFLLIGQQSISWLIDNTTVDTGVNVGDGAWHHLVAARTSASGAAALYVDGQLAWSGTVAAGVSPASGGSLMLAQDQDTVGGGLDASQSFAGSIDEVALFARALTGAEVSALYRGLTCQ